MSSGIKVLRSQLGLTLTQSNYVTKILKIFSHFHGTSAPTFDRSIALVRNQGKVIYQLEYCKILAVWRMT